MRKPNELGAAIRFIRLATNVSQEELAARADVSVSYISLIETGKRIPSWDVLSRLSENLKVPITLMMMLIERNTPFVKPIISLAYIELANRMDEENQNGCASS